MPDGILKKNIIYLRKIPMKINTTIILIGNNILHFEFRNVLKAGGCNVSLNDVPKVYIQEDQVELSV